MPEYVHSGDANRRVVEWRQSFPPLVPLEEPDIACPGSGAFSIMVVAEIRRHRPLEMTGRSG
jgi:hypothetical protein